jgi:hypothetical protein
MALSELELKRCERDWQRFADKRRPPPHLRAQLDLGWRVEGHTVQVFELRPHWRDPGSTLETPVAKATFVRSRGFWRLYWRRGDGKWHGYEPMPEALSFEAVLAVVDADEYCCFFG